MDHPPPIPFTPSPEAVSRILRDLLRPDLSLCDIADDHHTTIDALTLFLARPDIAARLAAMADAFAARARLVATAHLPTVAHMLTRMIDDHLDEAAHIPVNPKSLPAIEQRRRSRETARRAANLLLRIAKFQAGPIPSPSSPRGTGVPPVRSSRRRDSFPHTTTALPDAPQSSTSPPAHLPTSSSIPLPTSAPPTPLKLPVFPLNVTSPKAEPTPTSTSSRTSTLPRPRPHPS